MNGKGFRKLIKETLNIGSVHGLVDVDKLIPDPRTISRHISAIATKMRDKLMEQIQPVRNLCFCK